MNTETSLVQTVKKQTQRKFYVYFDDWTGKINSISNKLRQDLTDPYLLTDDPVVMDLMKGIKNTKKYVVAELVDGYKLVEKSNYLRIKQAEKHLSKIPVIDHVVNRDINLITYLSDYKLEINISADLIYQLTGKVNAKLLKIRKDENYDKIIFYITKKNNPLQLYETIEIDPIDIIQNGYKLYDLSHLRNKVALADIDILTRRIFKSYGLKIKQNYVTIERRISNKNRKLHVGIDRLENNSTFVISSTFTISSSTTGWIIKSNFNKPSEVKIYKDLKLFLTSNNPNVLLEKILIPYEKLGNFQEYVIKTTVNPMDCKILLENESNTITFKHEELEYVEPGKY